MNHKRILSVVLTVLIFTMSIIPCYAATTQDKLNEAKAAQEKAESNLSQTKDRINNLESQKNESETYLTDLNTQLEDLKESLERLQTEAQEKQTELEKVQKELEEAKVQEAKQYEDMKLRIQFMYEKSSSNYLEMLLTADNFAEFLNRADNISQISEYDRNMLLDYQKTKDEIADKEEAVKTEKEAIETLRQESADKQSQVEEVVANTYIKINEYATDIENAESEEAVLLSKISQQEDSINGLLKQAKDEEVAAAAKAEAQAKAESEKQASPSASSSTSEDNSSSDADSSSSSKNNEAEESGNSSPDDTQDEPQAESAEETSNSSGSGTYLGTFKLTAYCSCSRCCGSWSGGPTASGAMPSAGRTVAMGGVPFGTKLSINGQVYTVEDRGTAYGHVDIFMGNHSQALSFGLQYADVYSVG